MNKNIFIIASIGLLCLVGCKEEEEPIEEIPSPDVVSNINIENGLIQYYTFDEGNANDMTSGKHNGMTFNNPSYITDTPNGKGKAIFLNSAKEQYINIPYCPVSGQEAYSVAFWVKDFGTGTFITTICGNYYNSPTVRVNEEGYIVLHTGGYATDGRFYSTFKSVPFEKYQATGWHHIAITANPTNEGNKDNGLLSLYVDGLLIDNIVTGSGYIKAEGNKMQIGGNADGKFDYWATPMKIDNIRIYNRCISTSEVNAIYTLEK